MVSTHPDQALTRRWVGIDPHYTRFSCFPLKFRNFFDIGYNFVENCLFLKISVAPYCFAQLFRKHYLINAALFLHEILTYYRVRRPLQVEYKNYVNFLQNETQHDEIPELLRKTTLPGFTTSRNYTFSPGKMHNSATDQDFYMKF